MVYTPRIFLTYLSPLKLDLHDGEQQINIFGRNFQKEHGISCVVSDDGVSYGYTDAKYASLTLYSTFAKFLNDTTLVCTVTPVSYFQPKYQYDIIRTKVQVQVSRLGGERNMEKLTLTYSDDYSTKRLIPDNVPWMIEVTLTVLGLGLNTTPQFWCVFFLIPKECHTRLRQISYRQRNFSAKQPSCHWGRMWCMSHGLNI